jgi:hypothetical protein
MARGAEAEAFAVTRADSVLPFWMVNIDVALQQFLSGAKSIAYTLNRDAD